MAERETVLPCDIDREGAVRTTEPVHAAAGQISSWAPVDLADRDQAERWVDEAGAVRFSRIAELEVEDWSFTLRNELELAVWTKLRSASPPTMPAWLPRRRAG